MKKTRTYLTLAVLLFGLSASAQTDTLGISTAYTTHIIFPTDLTYADLSNSRLVVAKIIDQNRNMLALKARCEFNETTSISALESNGKMHTFIVKYEQSPKKLIIDTRERIKEQDGEKNNRSVSRNRKADAPLLPEVMEGRQELYHIGASRYGINVLCENILSYSDITYIVISLRNNSPVSYNITDATFVLESRRRGKRTVAFEKTLFPKNRYGNLSAAGKDCGKIVYSFDKMTLSEDQVLKVYLYEEDGQRNLEMTISAKDINKARNRFIRKK